jgi:DNA ligase-1
MISKHYTNEDPTGWWMSEKFDGIRGFWDGSQLFSRNSNVLSLPQSITDTFPKNMILDGEVWFGRNTLPESMKVVHHRQHIQWKDFQFIVFDAPKHGGTFEGLFTNINENI